MARAFARITQAKSEGASGREQAAIKSSTNRRTRRTTVFWLPMMKPHTVAIYVFAGEHCKPQWPASEHSGEILI